MSNPSDFYICLILTEHPQSTQRTVCKLYLSIMRPTLELSRRTPNVDVIWPPLTGGKPYFIPAGTRCLYSPYVMQRRKDLWGPTGQQTIIYIRMYFLLSQLTMICSTNSLGWPV